MDASLMASDGRAGAVAQVPGLKNPIRLARYLLEQDAHVMLSGREALELALRLGHEAGGRRDAGEDRLLAGAPDESLPAASTTRGWAPTGRARTRGASGTVGCVALDAAGRLAAAHVDGGHRPVLSGPRRRHADPRRRHLLHAEGRRCR